jgi:hypothetical protein
LNETFDGEEERSQVELQVGDDGKIDSTANPGLASISSVENPEKPTIDTSSTSWAKSAAIVCSATVVVAGCIWACQSGLFAKVCSGIRSFWRGISV